MSTTTIIKSDAQIKTDVINELKWDANVDPSEIGVQVRNGIVTLSGNVSAYAQKVAAVDAAHRVHGVLDVADELRTKLPKVWERSDEEVVKGVRDALRWDTLVPEERISTTVSSGIVTLEGNVDTWTQRADAERAVQRITGVRSVVNRISVAAPPANPEQIKHQIEGALERLAEHGAKRIGVAVAEGVVTLTGVVHSWGEKNAIERAAGYAPGVRRIDDRTTVDPYT